LSERDLVGSSSLHGNDGMALLLDPVLHEILHCRSSDGGSLAERKPQIERGGILVLELINVLAKALTHGIGSNV